MCAAAAAAIGCKAEDVLVCSTGVIGQTIKINVIEEGVPKLYPLLERSEAASDAAAHAIMTTDTVKKEAAVETTVGGKTVRMGGIAKGSGMIHPHMGTILCFLCQIVSDLTLYGRGNKPVVRILHYLCEYGCCRRSIICDNLLFKIFYDRCV